MTHHNESETIEAELERDRQSLASNLDELQDRVSVDHLAREALGMIRDNAGAYSRSIDTAIRANPLALTMTGVGLAWLIFGGRKQEPDSGKEAVNRWPSEAGHVYSPGDQTTGGQDVSGNRDDNAWLDRIDALRRRASAALNRLDQDARNYAGELRDYASERRQVVADFTSEMKASLMEGLDDLSESARDRVVRAREAAYAGRLRIERAARARGRELGGVMEDHPIVVGAVAMALGAAVAASLPRTRTEDRAFGAESDRLTDAAHQVLREERARMSRVAQDAVDEVKASARDATDRLQTKAAELSESLKHEHENEERVAASKAKGRGAS